MTSAEAITALERIAEQEAWDPEVAHSHADDVLLELVGPDVADAYRRLVDSCQWWACA